MHPKKKQKSDGKEIELDEPEQQTEGEFIMELRKLSRIEYAKKEPDFEFNDIPIKVVKKYAVLFRLCEHYEEGWDDIEKVKEDMKNMTIMQDKDIVWELEALDSRFTFTHHRDQDGDVDLEGIIPEELGDDLEEFLVEHFNIEGGSDMDNESKDDEFDEVEPPLEFTSKHDYTPDFLKALGELADIYDAEDDFRAKAFNKAKEALDGRIITAVEDIKLFNLIELPGVGKSTLEMFREFIETGKIEKLEEKRSKVNSVSKEEWDKFIDNHEPLRQYVHEEEFFVGVFPEDAIECWKYGKYNVFISCIYHERSVRDALEDIIDSNSDLRALLDSATPTYDIGQLKKVIEEYEFSLRDVHEEYFFEGYLVKDGTDIKTHPFKIWFSHEQNAYRETEVTTTSYGWTPPGLSKYLHEELNLGGGFEKRIAEWKEGE